MTIRQLDRGGRLNVERDTPLVCLPWTGEDDDCVRSLSALLSHTDASVPILLACATRERCLALADLPAAAEPDRELLTTDAGAEGIAAAIDAAAAVAAPGDVVAVAPGTRVGPGWLTRLRAAALSDSTIGTATPLADDAGALSVGPGSGERFDEDTCAVAARSPRAYPRVGAGGAHAIYMRRAALDLAGRVRPGDDALEKFSARVLERGLVHVAADDVYVTSGAAPLDTAAPTPAPAGEPESHDEGAVLQRSLACARTALRGLSVTIDARALGPGVGGTQAYIVELVLALARSGSVRLRVVVPPDLSPLAARSFASAPSLEVISYDQALAGVPRSDVVHRPQQVFTEDDLELLRRLGERIVVDHQDLIAYRNPAYHDTRDDWLAYRRVSRLALASADRALFFSKHACDDAVGEDLVPLQRTSVIGIGADERAADAPVPKAPAGAPPDEALLVCLGADYQHKNRPFAIALLDALNRDHGFDGRLALAGPHVRTGSSREEEARLIAASPAIAGRVVDLGPVDEAGRAWLLSRARAVVYPTTYEGFGLVPFEAARAGVPCLFAPQAALIELAGANAATLVPWDAAASAAAVWPLLADGPARDEHVEQLQAAAARHRWTTVVDRLVGAYQEAVASPRRSIAPRVWLELERERFIAHLAGEAERNWRAYEELREEVDFAKPLAARGGLLSRDEQRGLMRIASRRTLRRLLLTPFRALGRLGAGRQ